MSDTSILENLFLALPSLCCKHAPTSRVSLLLKQVARREVEELFSDIEPKIREFKPFGELVLPYYKMGAIDSLDLFALDELIMFSFYWLNRERYKHVLDIGANIGLHSIILSKCGFEVRSFEPDPQHFEILQKNLALNNCNNVQAFNAAVSSKSGEMEFIRVLGNTTASHLAGSRPDPYGEIEKFSVRVEAIEPMLKWADLIKMDIEGHEKEIFKKTPIELWKGVDVLLEVQNEDNAEFIFNHFKSTGINLFSEKSNWQQVKNFSEMPINYSEGTLFLTHKTKMPWS